MTDIISEKIINNVNHISLTKDQLIAQDELIDTTTHNNDIKPKQKESIDVESKSLLNRDYPDYVEKYFSKYYVDNVNEEGDNYCVLVHSNRVCIITLADSHVLKKSNKIPVKVDFQISDKVNRNDNAMTGKGKRGAQQLFCSSILCHVTCEDGTKYSIQAAVAGKLLDINKDLIANPVSIMNSYVAIILPSIPTFETFNLPLKNDDGFFDVDCDS